MINWYLSKQPGTNTFSKCINQFQALLCYQPLFSYLLFDDVSRLWVVPLALNRQMGSFGLEKEWLIYNHFWIGNVYRPNTWMGSIPFSSRGFQNIPWSFCQLVINISCWYFLLINGQIWNLYQPLFHSTLKHMQRQKTLNQKLKNLFKHLFLFTFHFNNFITTNLSISTKSSSQTINSLNVSRKNKLVIKLEIHILY